jgi:hypothetical protein
MNFRDLFFASAFAIALGAPSSAATYGLGDVTSGVITTNVLSVQTVDFIDFSFEAAAGSFVSMLNIFVTSTAGSNFRPIIGLYAGTALVASNDSGASGGTASLSFSGLNVLSDGFYTLGIGAWKSSFPDDIANAGSSAYFNNGSYTARIEPTISPVPLPMGGLLLLTGLGALAIKQRKNRKM